MTFAKRKNTRLENWDYASTAYYHVVFCTVGHEKLLGEVVYEPLVGCRVELSADGVLVDEAVKRALQIFPDVDLAALCIMPNHVHMLVGLREGECGSGLGSFVRCVKSGATRLVRQERSGAALWQRGYYDHAIRGDDDFQLTVEYIANNPGKWAEDKYYV